MWLVCEKDSAAGSVVTLFCEVCCMYKDRYSLYEITRLFGSEN